MQQYWRMHYVFSLSHSFVSLSGQITKAWTILIKLTGNIH